LAGERWCYYYHEKYEVDVRSLRYPGLISYNTEPGGGTTDYAVDIFYKALETQQFECFLAADTKLPMMYMPDAIKATIELMEADSNDLTIWSSYNVNSFSFSPEELTAAIQEHIPEFEIKYEPDYREKIAQSWPQSIDDTQARHDWNWQPDYDLADMTEDMLKNIRKKAEANT
jgi:nucleoside-diphosphate-sugar epimerase